MEKITMSVLDLAGQMGVSAPTAYRLAKSPGFPVIHVGKRLVIPVDAFQRWLEAQTKLDTCAGGDSQ